MKKFKEILTDYWFGTITGAVLIATSLQMIISSLATYYPQLFGNRDDFGPNNFFAGYFLPQIFGGIVAILLGLLFLAVRKQRP